MVVQESFGVKIHKTPTIMSIVTATHENIDDWLSLRKAVYTGLDDSFHSSEISRFLSDPELNCFLHYIENEATGFIEVTLRNIVDGCLSSPVGYIEGIFVKPNFRHKGIAKDLLNIATKWCVEQGCTELATDAELANMAAQNFHLNMGFEETYRIVEYKKRIA